MPAAQAALPAGGSPESRPRACWPARTASPGRIPQVIFHQWKRNENRVILNFRKPESFHALSKYSDHRETEFAHAQTLSDRVRKRKRKFGELRGDQANPAALGHILGIQEPASQDQQIANLLESFGHAHQVYVALDGSRINGGLSRRAFPPRPPRPECLSFAAFMSSMDNSSCSMIGWFGSMSSRA